MALFSESSRVALRAALAEADALEGADRLDSLWRIVREARRSLGERDADTVAFLVELADELIDGGDHEEADALLAPLLHRRVGDDPMLVRVMPAVHAAIARLHDAEGDMELAVEHGMRALVDQATLFGEGPLTLEYRLRLAPMLDQARHDDALEQVTTRALIDLGARDARVGEGAYRSRDAFIGTEKDAEWCAWMLVHRASGRSRRKDVDAAISDIDDAFALLPMMSAPDAKILEPRLHAARGRILFDAESPKCIDPMRRALATGGVEEAPHHALTLAIALGHFGHDEEARVLLEQFPCPEGAERLAAYARGDALVRSRGERVVVPSCPSCGIEASTRPRWACGCGVELVAFAQDACPSCARTYGRTWCPECCRTSLRAEWLSR